MEEIRLVPRKLHGVLFCEELEIYLGDELEGRLHITYGGMEKINTLLQNLQNEVDSETNLT